jgi:hypothetical protein
MPVAVGMRLRHLSVLVSGCALVAVACAGGSRHAPRDTSRPALNGASIIGRTLTVSRGSWSFHPTSYSYRWQDCARRGYCAWIGADTSQSYTVHPNDFYYRIRAEVRACNVKGCVSAFSPPTARVTGAEPSGVGLPPSTQTDSFGTKWREVGEDNFTIDAPLGSWRTSSPTEVVYRGDHGLLWVEYPDGWPCGAFSHCYHPAKVLSVHDGVLDYWLHDGSFANGAVRAMGADPSPLIPTTGTQYQTYGRYEARFKVVFDDRTHLNQYHIAWLLWPKPPGCGESDFPEMDLDQPVVGAFAHWLCSGRQSGFFARIRLTQWHTFTQEWGPGFRRYYLDGKLLGQSTRFVYSGPERWQLQTEAHNKTGDRTSGHLLVDWVWIGTLSSQQP